MRRYRALLATYLRPQWPRVALLAVVLLANVALQLVNPLLLRRFIDSARAGAALRTLTTTALLFLAIALAAQATAVLEAYVAEDVSWTATNRLRTDLAAHLLRLDMGFHTTHLPGELVQRIDYDVGLLGTLGTALAFAIGGSLFRHGAISIGTAYLLVSYAALISQPLIQLTGQMQDLQQATAAISRVQELFALHSAVADSTDAQLPVGALAVELRSVSFAYASGQPVLQGISFALGPGRVLGVLGRTGSGKTTLTRLLLRLHDPTAGVVRLGGIDLRNTTQRQICRRVALVTQEVQLFQGTVRDNLAFFDPAIPDTHILAALGELGLWSWYAALPHGLDSELAAGGSGLSAGEAQLLAFTRVFLRDPALVILDEASSRLDPATERAIERAIDRLLRGRTAIVVAHRLATVQRADELLILEDGRIAEHGRREQLTNDPASRFAGLLRTGLEVAFA